MIAGRYRLGEILGCGGMAEVRDGWDIHLGRPVAVKLLHPFLASQPDMRRRFRDEARAAARLDHPNIVSVFDSGEHEGVPFIVMERLPGTSLADEIGQGPLPSTRVHSVLDDVLSALTVAHGAGILHRDIKPGNILHTVSGRTVKLGDFGIAKAVDAGTVTKTGEMLGTMAYLSPERIAGAPASITDDLYAVGVVGFEALTGRPRFSRDNAGALAHAIMTDRPPPVSVLRPDAAPGLASTIDRATAPVPHHRFASAAEMRTAVTTDGPLRSPTKVLAAPATQHPATFSYIRPLPDRPARRTKVLAALGIVALAALTATVVVAASDSPATPTVPNPETSAPSPAPTTSPPSVGTPLPAPEPGSGSDGNANSGNGKGNGNENGNGKKKKDDDD